MTRLALIPAVLTAGPALAHSEGAFHLHETDSMSLLLGLALVGFGAGAATLLRMRKK